MNPSPGNIPVDLSIQGRLTQLLLIALLVFCYHSSFAHFKLNLNIRVIHVEHQTDGLHVYLRLPMAYLVANLVGEEQADGSRVPAPFTTNALVDGELMHLVDYEAFRANPVGLGELAAAGHHMSVASADLMPEVLATRLHTGLSQPPFSTLAEAKAAFGKAEPAPVEPAPFVGDAVVDVYMVYRYQGNIRTYTLSSTLDPKLPGQDETANLIIDYGGREPYIFRLTGLLSVPVEISHSIWKSASTFVSEGVKHIIAGYDHVLFVVCLVLGASALVTLAWRVTGFTLGHTLTLSLGFFGYVPSAQWFIPLVETGIALSIIVAAIIALSTIESRRGSSGSFLMTVAIGMLHGLGFSFVLQEILGVSAPNVWISLLAFNLGVEFGQIAIVLLLWPLLMWVSHKKPGSLSTIIWSIALPCIAVAAYWTGQRMIGFLSSV